MNLRFGTAAERILIPVSIRDPRTMKVLIALALAFALVFTLRTVAWAGFSSLPDPVTHWAARIDEVCGRNHAA